MIPPIPLPAWLFVLLYGGIELMFGVSGSQVAVAHFGGMIGGYLVIRWHRGQGWARWH